MKRIGILTGGGDCPGINAVIRAVAKAALIEYGCTVVGVRDGFQGLIEDDCVELGYEDVSGILTQGGTILGTSNIANPFHTPFERGGKTFYRDISRKCFETARRHKLDALICIGGDGTMNVTGKFYQRGMNVVGVPKTIDNDLAGTDITFGFDSARTTVAEAIDKLHTTAQSHHRVMVIEVMGRYAGHLALEGGIAGGGDVILIPEIPYKIESVAECLVRRSMRGKRFSIVVVAEGAKPKGGKMVIDRILEGSPDPYRLGGIGQRLAREIERTTSLETRVTVLGHLQRGGAPTPFDRILATRFGYEAVRLARARRFGRMVSLKGSEVTSVTIKDAIRKLRTVPLNSNLLRVARSVGTCFGD